MNATTSTALPLQPELDAMVSHAQPDDPDFLLGLTQPMRALMASGRIQEELWRMLTECLDNPDHKTRGVLHGRVLLGTLAGVHLMLRTMEIDASLETSTVQSSPSSALVGVLGPGRLCADVYAAGADWRWDRLEASDTLAYQRHERVHSGELLRIDGRREVVRMWTEGPTAVLMLVARPHAKLLWEFELPAGRPTRSLSAAPLETRLQFVADILDRLGHPSSVPSLRAICDHPCHHVRWHGLQALVNVDRPEGLRRLDAAVQDPHPHIRAAARRSLERITAREVAA